MKGGVMATVDGLLSDRCDESERVAVLDEEEAKAVYEVMDQLSGGNPGGIFNWGGLDDPAHPQTSAFVKIYKLAGKPVPNGL